MNKILFTDLDGTLLNNASVVSPEMIACLKQMLDAGNRLVLSSGRPLGSILEVKKKAGLNWPGIFVIANNGSLIYDCDSQKNIHEIRVSFEQVKTVFRIAQEQKVHIQTYTDQAIITPNEDAEIKVYLERVHLPLILSKSPCEHMEKPPFKLLAIDLNEKQHLDIFADAVQKETNNTLSAIFSNDRYLEIISSAAGKGNALTWLCHYLNIPINCSIASGDALNDLSMLQAAGLSVAMLGGDEELKKYADITTKKTNDDNGLIDIIQKYILS